MRWILDEFGVSNDDETYKVVQIHKIYIKISVNIVNKLKPSVALIKHLTAGYGKEEAKFNSSTHESSVQTSTYGLYALYYISLLSPMYH